MSSFYTVVYDACVLYPAPLRSLLIHMAITDLFRARWSDLIHEEWIRNLLAQRSDLTREQLNRVRELMDLHTRDAVVSGFEPLIDGLVLPDPDDRHVRIPANVTGHYGDRDRFAHGLHAGESFVR